eukprot:CAMPEP_0202458134 /NCGR_PEP_ID=MMETSP1360-20130828/22263_1 /ASSEMBLY_ACC=CAM_ASM_000848 /TAXON_ID=515479 /ORGANISM="Licmophora paradoxa, Strain CCMP2313" /LENGTH=195 /DNA_ID=CAMNT_0049078539 /DNA_START=90 /DNA_END=677 /DNA_ORIENTATION=+
MAATEIHQGELDPNHQCRTTHSAQEKLLLPVASSSNNAVRVRYLNRLGIVRPRQDTDKLITIKSLRPRSPSISEPLKKDYGQEDEETLRSPRSYPGNRRKRAVSFDNSVTVQKIPLCSEYSKRVAKDLWLDRKELQEMEYRNSIEFRSENWDWKQVREDLIRTPDGQYIHPVHFIRRCTMHHQFLRVMSAMQCAG